MTVKQKPINYKNLYTNYEKLNEIIKIKDDVNNNLYPMPINSTHQNEISIGRIRPSLIYGDYDCELFVCGDQLLKGAVYN